MVKCVFCGKDEDSFRGLHLLKNDGSVAYYCSSKCRKNALKLGRDKRRVKWTEAYKIKLAEEIEKTKREAKKAEDKKAAKEKK